GLGRLSAAAGARARRLAEDHLERLEALVFRLQRHAGRPARRVEARLDRTSDEGRQRAARLVRPLPRRRVGTTRTGVAKAVKRISSFYMRKGVAFSLGLGVDSPSLPSFSDHERAVSRITT